MVEGLVKYFDKPDEVREFPKGRFEVVTIRGASIGRATYQPGWKWSEHVGPSAGTQRCTLEHLGVVLAGNAVVSFDDGTLMQLGTGSLFHVPAVPHDSWVVGSEPYVSLHLQGAQLYAK